MMKFDVWSYSGKSGLAVKVGGSGMLMMLTVELGVPGGLVVRIQHFNCCGPGSIPGWGTDSPQAVQHVQKNKAKQRVLNGCMLK